MCWIQANLAALGQQMTKSMVGMLETAYPLPNTRPSDRHTTTDPISSQLPPGDHHRCPPSLTPQTPDYPSPAHILPVFQVAAGGPSVHRDSTKSPSRQRDGAEPRVGVAMGRHDSTRYSEPVPSTVETLLTADAPTPFGQPCSFSLVRYSVLVAGRSC